MDPNDQNSQTPVPGAGDGQSEPTPVVEPEMPGTGAPEVTPPPPVVGDDTSGGADVPAEGNSAGPDTGGEAPAA